jgi:hypothetical protein
MADKLEIHSSPVARAILTAPCAADVADSVHEWLRRAEIQEDVYYFSIQVGPELVGQILLWYP